MQGEGREKREERVEGTPACRPIFKFSVEQPNDMHSASAAHCWRRMQNKLVYNRTRHNIDISNLSSATVF